MCVMMRPHVTDVHLVPDNEQRLLLVRGVGQDRVNRLLAPPRRNRLELLVGVCGVNEA